MTILEVSSVSAHLGGAWCTVFCRQGVLAIGEQLTSVRLPDGSTAGVALTVGAIQSPTGPVARLETYTSAQVLLTGQGSDALRPGCALQGVSPLPQYPSGQSEWPYQTQTTGSPLGPSDLPFLIIEEKQHLSRLTTAFRLLLAVPQLVVLYAFTIAAEVIVVISWFAALVMGRLPSWAADFLQSYLVYQTRLYGYLLLLTDDYPPFGFSASRYAVHVELPPPGRLNRWSVFFRLLLAVPATVLSGIIAWGWLVASFVIWVVVLVMGRFPAALFRAGVAVLRFQLRTNAYAILLTSRYPRGLYGEADSRDDRGLVLPRAAKVLVSVFIVLGLLGWGGYAAGIALFVQQTASKQEALNELRTDFNTLDLTSLAANLTACRDQPDPLSCVQPVESQMALRLDTFKLEIDDIDHPAGTDDAFDELSRQTHRFAAYFHELADAGSAADYSAIVTGEDPAGIGVGFDDAYNALVSELQS